MKKLNIYLILFLAFAFNANAQEKSIGKKLLDLPTTRVATAEDGAINSKGISPNTAFLLLDMKAMAEGRTSLTEEELRKKYSLMRRGNVLYANSFIVCDGNNTIASLDEFGVIPGSKSAGIYTGLVPINQIAKLAASPKVKYVQIGEKVHLMMDSARRATNVTKVHQGLAPLTMPYTGKGVVVADLDIGFDYTHPNFYDSTGTNNYRIKRVWEQENNSGTPPAGYNYGTELSTQSAILAKGTDNAFGDHGSHVTGIAAGSGGYPGSPYRGVAYESDIVLVALNEDGTDAQVADGIRYVQNYAASVSKPSVVNMSFGTILGPHDGTSLFCKYMDSLVGPGKLLINAAGNSGAEGVYVSNKFIGNQGMLTFLAKDTGHIQIWGVPGENFEVTLVLYDIINGGYPAQLNTSYAGNTTLATYDTIKGGPGINPIPVKISSGINTDNNKPQVKLEILPSALPNPGMKILIVITANNTSIQMWSEEKNSFTDFGMGYPFKIGSTDYSVGDNSSGNSTICVGAYTSTNTWTALNSTIQQADKFSAVGDIAPFSSRGPTADGRTKPDITAPGNEIASSVNSFSTTFPATFPGRLVKSVTYGSKTWYFAMYHGTSMACPMVTGIIALWLQKYPNLTRAQALDMMKKTAITDNYTGTIPAIGSNTWGWGKINAFMGMTLSVEKAAVNNTLKVYPNPANNLLHIAFDKQASNTLISISDVTGKVVYSKEAGTLAGGSEHVVSMENNPAGVYILRIASNGEEAVYKIVKQ